MDDKARKAEELLEERLRTRTNGPTHGVVADAEVEAPVTQAKVEELTNDLQRMTADFANYRKRNDSERSEFAKFAKADLIAKLLDVLDGYDRALATVPEELKGQPWGARMGGRVGRGARGWGSWSAGCAGSSSPRASNPSTRSASRSIRICIRPSRM